MRRPGLPRKICALLVVLGLLFAATVASVTHSVAMPMMDSHLDAAMMQQGDAASAVAGHDCADMAPDDMPAPANPCQQGCLLCTGCSLTGIVLPAAPAMLEAGPYHDYQPAVVLAPAGINPALPSEPPRL